MTEFKPQGTTMDTFQQIESRLFDAFKDAGFPSAVAEAIAHSFTQYMLGYLTEEGVARRILDSGAKEDLARDLARRFKALRDDDNPKPSDGPHISGRDDRTACLTR